MATLVLAVYVGPYALLRATKEITVTHIYRDTYSVGIRSTNQTVLVNKGFSWRKVEEALIRLEALDRLNNSTRRYNSKGLQQNAAQRVNPHRRRTNRIEVDDGVWYWMKQFDVWALAVRGEIELDRRGWLPWGSPAYKQRQQRERFRGHDDSEEAAVAEEINRVERELVWKRSAKIKEAVDATADDAGPDAAGE